MRRKLLPDRVVRDAHHKYFTVVLRQVYLRFFLMDLIECCGVRLA